MKSIITRVNLLFSAMGAGISLRYRDALPAVGVMIGFMVIDYLSGMMASAREAHLHPDDPNYGLSSNIGMLGIYKKIGYFFIVGVACGADYILSLFGDATTPPAPIFTMAILAWLLANELLSIIENLGRLGVPVPNWLINVIAGLKDKAEKTDGGVN